jgi:endonuclease G, mitochondrial
VLDQSPVLDLSEAARAVLADRERERVAAGAVAVPDLGPFRTFQAPVADVAALTGLAMPGLVEADRMARPGAVEGPPGAAGWREVTRPGELRLGP